MDFPIPAPPMRQMNYPPARTKRKYAGARPFFLVVLVLSAVALWTLLRDGQDSNLAADGNALLRRAAERPLEAHGSLKKQDLDV